MSKILLADDNPHAQRMGSQILSQEGHDVTTVSDGEEAMAHLAEHQPALVMVDTRMPGPSGLEICRHLKSDPTTNAIKVVLLAGPLEPFDEDEASEAGSDGVLHKPLDAFTLIERVNSLLDIQPSDGNHDDEEGVVVEDSLEPPEPFGDLPEEGSADARSAAAVEESDGEPIEISFDSEPETESKPEAESKAEEQPDGAAAPAEEDDIFEIAADEPAPAEAVLAAVDDDLSDAFESVVADALWTATDADLHRGAVREAVQEVLEAALPAIVDRITEKVVERLAPR